MRVQDAKVLANDLMQTHGLTAWTLKTDQAKNRFGQCRWTQKVISLSEPLIKANTPERVKATIIHEIAHALTPGAGHGTRWKLKAISLGHTGQRTYNETNTVIPKGNYTLYCPECKISTQRHRKTLKLMYCGACYRRTKNMIQLKWRTN